MARLTEEMVIARSKQSDLSAIKKLNCWGAELGDVSLLRRMPNVEVLAFSINKIRTLDDFAACRRLRELYVRKNEIRDLREIRHLRRLPALTSLWLDENPCTTHPQYRMTVLRNLPNLEKLDNVPVQPEEVQEAMRRGSLIPDSDDEGYPQQEQQAYSQYRPRSCDSSPSRESMPAYRNEPRPPSRGSPDDDRYTHPAMTSSHYEPRPARSPDAPLRHSVSAHSVKEYAYPANGECRYAGGGERAAVTSPPHYHDPYCERPDRPEAYPQREWNSASERERDREYPSAVMAEHRGFTRRPVARNSNLLSAVLCLVKELDYPSLEVAEMAVRCRMDELANSQ
ncbi:cilia- and flagella-associated protein 410 isoform X3 [Amyelois transitella]|uniref:cilia- and flagella-associated protein 410 isoform X3 n=1 Tax=Amyelois transitella TaxID=680683 RepID=UPI0029900520|nr:cilia- and flagella-associated protein 410 isoform X3 [Amyelois transitella]